MPEAAVADDADRLHGLADQQRRVEVGGVEPEAALVAGDRQLGGEPHADRRTAGRLRHAGGSSCRSRGLRSPLVVIAGEVELIGERRERIEVRDVQPVVEPAVDLDLGNRADAEADAERRQPQQVAREPRDRVEDRRAAWSKPASIRTRPEPMVSGSSVTSGRCCASARATSASRPISRAERTNRRIRDSCTHGRRGSSPVRRRDQRPRRQRQRHGAAGQRGLAQLRQRV